MTEVLHRQHTLRVSIAFLVILAMGCDAAGGPNQPVHQGLPGESTAIVEQLPNKETPAPRTSELTEVGNRTLQAVEQEILAACDKVRSFSAEFINEALQPVDTIDVEDPRNLRLGVHSKGTLDVLKREGKLLGRMVMYDTAWPGHGHGPQVIEGPVERTTTQIFDGEHLYTIMEFGAQVKASKVKTDHFDFVEIGGKLLVDHLHSACHTLTLEPDETIDGRGAYVISGRSEAMGRVSVRCSIDKATGLRLRLALYDRSGTLVQVFSLANLKVNVEFPEDHFTFVPPEGLKVEE